MEPLTPREIEEAYNLTEHGISERVTPYACVLTCSCGRWQYETTRRKARTARREAAAHIAAHRDSKLKRACDTAWHNY